jgi:eukaryotic-like serine/threonine-protein kinase
VATSRIAEQVGRVLGDRYRLTRPLGTGASAHVYVAEDVSLRRRVAVKLLHSALADDPAFLRRFQAEAQAVAALRHPNVLRVYDWGEDDDAPYLVMELLEGGSLRSLLDRGERLTPSQALLVGLDAAHALDYAHRRGLVHRDIKPSNILFDDEGRLCIADFGLARALAEAAWTEPAGAVVGTARYAAPEQVKGLALDGRADVYALALTLVESVTGRVPFAVDTTLGTLMARTERAIPVTPELGALGPVIEASGTVDPGERLDAAAMARALEVAAQRLPSPRPLPLAGPLVTGQPEADPDETELAGRRTVLFDGAAGGAPGAVGADADPTGTAVLDLTGTASRQAADAGEPPGAGADRRRSRRRWRRALMLIAILILAGGAAALAATRVLAPTHPVPSLGSDDVTTARQALAPLKLHLHVSGRAYDDQIPPGEVLRQHPAPGAKQREGAAVSVVLSLGPPPVAVPDLTGLTVDQAQQRLTGAGLKLGNQTSRSDNVVLSGVIVSWSGQGGKLTKFSAVDVVVSSGKPTVAVPDVHGQSFGQAQQALAAVQLTAVEDDEFNDTVPKGQVAGTDPGANAQAPIGSQVKVTVSKGPDLVQVPPVRGLSVDAATAQIKAAGLTVGGVVGDPTATVYVSNPPSGSMVKRGSAVKLYTS